jgi:integrase
MPLSNQVIEILQGLKPITGGREFVFALSEKPLSDVMPMKIIRKVTAVIKKDLDLDMVVTAHGFRATARTLIAERLKFDPRYIELQLSHAVPEVHGTAYNRALYIEERTMMMQRWSDYLDQVRLGRDGSKSATSVLQFPVRGA